MPDAVALTRPTALVAEDEALVRVCAVEFLEELGFAVLEAGDGLEALDLIRACPEIALLFSDCRMPGMDGPTLAAEAVRLRPGLPVVLATGYTSTCLSAWTVLRKPYCAEDVRRVLRRALPGLDQLAA